MARPDDSAMAIAAQRALRLEALPQIMARRVLHEAPGRAAERVEMDLVTVAVKWRDDRTQDREALLYADLAPTVLQALGAPRMLGATTMAASHLLFLEWVEGTPANWEDPEHVQLAFGHLGRVHAITARLLAGPPEGAATAAAWAELFPDPYMVGARNEEPLVLDPRRLARRQLSDAWIRRGLPAGFREHGRAVEGQGTAPTPQRCLHAPGRTGRPGPVGVLGGGGLAGGYSGISRPSIPAVKQHGTPGG